MCIIIKKEIKLEQEELPRRHVGTLVGFSNGKSFTDLRDTSNKKWLLSLYICSGKHQNHQLGYLLVTESEICTGLKNEIGCTHARTNWDPYNAFL